MHVIIGFLGSLVTVLWLLYRLADMGVDLAGLNPFLWSRRRKWRKFHDANPVYKITSPLDLAALLITATAKADGDMSSEEKQHVLSIFKNEFHLHQRDAAALLISSSHLLGRGDEVRANLKGVVEPSLDSFTPEQARSTTQLMQRIANLGSGASELQRQLIDNTSKLLARVEKPKSQWT